MQWQGDLRKLTGREVRLPFALYEVDLFMVRFA